MSKRRISRQAASRRATAARRFTPYSLYRRALRYEPLEDRRLLAVVTVNTLSDVTDLNDNLTTLREAIFATNLVPGADTITFAPALTANGPATILLTQGELRITDSLTITGPGANLLTIDASGSDPTPATKNGDGARIFNIDNGNNSTFLDVSVSGVCLTGGDAGSGGGAILSVENVLLTEVVIRGNAAVRGGGIASRFGGLSLVNSTVANNVARTSEGGGIFVSDSTRELVISGSAITNNAAVSPDIGNGGGISSHMRTTIQDSTISGNSTAGAGGGIHIIGILTVRNCTIDSNTSSSTTNAGGGIHAYQGNSTIVGSTITNNKALQGEGGGIRQHLGSLLIEDSIVNNNSALWGGGVSASDNVTVQINRTTINSNAARIDSYGGGVFILKGTLLLIDSAVNDNVGSTSAGLFGDRANINIVRTTFLRNSGSGIGTSLSQLWIEESTISENTGTRGGGIELLATAAQIVSSSISNNKASSFGGGVFNSGGELSIRFSTITGNQALADGGSGVASRGSTSTSTIVVSSIVAGNLSSDVDVVMLGAPDSTNSFQSLGHNLVGTGTAVSRFNQSGDQTGILDPLLGPLANNGGPTLTHALLPGSPAINAGDLSAVAGVNGVPLLDQRGTPFGRVFNGRIDIGAFEYQQPSDLNLLVDTLVDENDGNYSRGDLSLREAIALANLWPSTDTIRFDPALTANGPATIVLTQGELKITSSMSIIGLGADVLTIDASGSDPTPAVKNGDGSRVFNIDDGVVTASIVIISGLTLTGGDVASGGAVLSRESLVLAETVIDRNFASDGGGVATVLRDGAALVVVRSQVSNNLAAVRGGGLSMDVGAGSAVLISDVQIQGNSKRFPQSITATTFAGGGIYIVNSGGTVAINDSVVSDNISDGAGGGISFSGPLNVQRSTIARNSAVGAGGGIHLRTSAGGGLSLFDSKVTDNEAIAGGGVALFGSSAAVNVIERSEIARNSAERRSGTAANGVGGGIYFEQGSLRLSHSTVLHNSADVDGGGLATIPAASGFRPSIFIDGSTVVSNFAARNGGGLSLTSSTGMLTNIVHSTIAHNEASTAAGGVYVASGVLDLNHSIVALNTSPAVTDDIARGASGQVTAAWSLIGNNNGSGLAEAPIGLPDASGNLVGGATHGLIDPLLRPLANYGGLTPTLALAAGSPAINSGNPAAAAGVGNVPLYDQRGFPFGRVVNGRIDIGAFEFRTPPGTTLIVDTLADESDGNYAAGDLSLREALQLANLDADANTIRFSPALTASGAATIVLYRGAIDIVGNVTIIGPGANLLTIDASGSDPTPGVADGRGSSIFEIGDGTDDLLDVSISGLKLTGGDSQYGGAIVSTENLTITGSVITGNHAAQLGGGVAVLYGSVEIADCIISGNTTDGTGGGIAASSAELFVDGCTIDDNVAAVGGGIHAFDTLLSVSNSSVDNNEAIGGGGAGGGIYSKDGKLTVVDSTVSGNTSISGGGIYSDGEADIVRSTLNGNYSYLHGGGIYSFGKLVVRHTTISGSGTGLDGAGIRAAGDVRVESSTFTANDAGRYGGAIWVEVVGDTLTIINSTISGNHSDNEGGGVWITGAEATASIAHSTIVENTSNHLFGFGGGVALNSGSLQLDHAIVAKNAAKTGPDLFARPGTQLATRYSLIGNSQDTSLNESPVGLPDANGNLIGGPVHGVIDPLLGPLADNGGSTLTHALLPGSPAINAGNPTAFPGVNGVPPFDQRDAPFGRVGRIDIGAFEYQLTSNLTLVVDTLVDENDGNYGPGDLSLREAIALADVWPDDDTIYFDPALTSNGPATIVLTKGELKITTSMSIVGPGANLLTIDASGNDPTPNHKDGLGSRIVSISSFVSLSGMTFTGGDSATKGGAILAASAVANLEDMRIANNSSLDAGGGISALLGSLTITRSAITNNQASVGGGGIDVSRCGLVVTNSTISGNILTHEKGIGGGVYFSKYSGGSLLEITNTVISNNVAPLVGGGIAARTAGGVSRIANSEISGNTSLSDLGPRGAGLYLFGYGTTTIESSNIHHNSVNSIGRGGGIFSAVNLRLNDVTISSNYGGVDGGGILSVANLWLTDCIVTQNATVNSAGGGGISMNNLYNVQITGSAISNNLGSGIRQTLGYLTIHNSRISGNSTSGSGGGIHTGATVTNVFIWRSEVRDNRAAESGGGIYKAAGELVVMDSTIAANWAGANGGGVASLANEDSYTSSTISGNHASINGGGVWAGAGQTFAYSTITLNSAGGTGGGVFLAAGSTIAKNTIAAGNAASSGVDISGLLGAQFAARYSLIGSSQGSGLAPTPGGVPDVNGNLVGGVNAIDFIDPRLAPLAKHGGPTRTHALLPGSPAINAGDLSAVAGVNGVPQFDQRGTPFTRVFAGRIDIGAFEVQPEPPPGDFNLNGVVDSADYVLWRNTKGSTLDLRADGNGDGVVDNADYQIWRANFGNTRPVIGAAANFEPVATIVAQATSASNTVMPDRASDAVRAPIAQALAQFFAPRNALHQRPVGLSFAVVERQAGGLLAWLAERENARTLRPSVNERAVPSGQHAKCEAAEFKADAVDEVFATLQSTW